MILGRIFRAVPLSASLYCGEAFFFVEASMALRGPLRVKGGTHLKERYLDQEQNSLSFFSKKKENKRINWE